MKILANGRIAAIAATAVMCVGGSVTSAQASTAPPLRVGQTPAHVCKVIGETPDIPSSGSTVQGVVCIDLATANVNGHPTAVGHIEAICQSPSGNEMQCAEVDADGQLWNAFGGHVANSGGAHCGHQFGPCSATRNIWSAGQWAGSNGDCTSVGNDTWAIARGNIEEQWNETRIELPATAAAPNGTWVAVDYSNISTGHYTIC
jgi:hypothetical protein